MLRDNFGKYLGNLLAILYILYFIDDASSILRNFSEFMIVTIYHDTPLFFIIFAFVLLITYMLRSGIETSARVCEIFVPFVFLIVFLTNLVAISKYDYNNFLPVLEHGIKPLLKVAQYQFTWPFGQAVVFLMIFPYLNKKNKIFKTSFLSTLIVGLIMLSMALRDLLVLGPDMVLHNLYPSMITAKMISQLSLEPFLPVILLIGTMVKDYIFIFAALLGIAQLFNLDDYNIFIKPFIILIAALAIWDFESLLEFLAWSSDIWLYFAIPFHVIIPALLLIISLVKKRLSKLKNS